MNFSLTALLPIFLLVCSNLFMTVAWYGHLKFTDKPLWMAVMASWMIALVEYWFAVPANRWGSTYYSVAELKTIQEVITFAVFIGFAKFFLGQTITYNHILGFIIIIIGAAVVFRG